MSRMLCKCGETMGTSITPSPYVLYIYNNQEVQSAISDNPKILLSDFLTDWDEVNGKQKKFMKRLEDVEYWFCPKCQRVYETQAEAGGYWLRVYNRTENPLPNISLENWKDIYIFKEVETDVSLENSPQILLTDYLKTHENIRYYLSPDEKTVIAISVENQKFLFAYIQEEPIVK